jgi:hypothetical protein
MWSTQPGVAPKFPNSLFTIFMLIGWFHFQTNDALMDRLDKPITQFFFCEKFAISSLYSHYLKKPNEKPQNEWENGHQRAQYVR